MYDRALKILFRDKRLFVALYSPADDATYVDFATGERAASYSISYTEGALVSTRDLKDFARRSSADNLTAISSTLQHLILPKAPVAVTVRDKVVIHGQTHAVKDVDSSSYASWQTLTIEHLVNQDLFLDEAHHFTCSDRVRVYIDELARAVKEHYSGTVPGGTSVWPIVGFTTANSMQALYGTNKTYTGDIVFKELGRKSGYSGTGTVEGGPPDLATTYTQVNDVALQPYMDTFNGRVGRL